MSEIVGQVERNTITLLQAEPGAGKTTRVPPALLQQGSGSVYVLEPRRLATRLAAQRVAEELQEPLGKTVGYQVRFERVGGSSTRLWYLTEGVFTNRLLSGTALPLRSVVILDEFHERHLETDLALTLLRKLCQTRTDLRILIMSATLGGDLSARLPHAPLIQVNGRSFPVDVQYTPASPAALELQVASAVAGAAAATDGHILVFLPGAAEIRSSLQACRPLTTRLGAQLLPLYGDLSAAEQDRAVARSTARKVICATNVAESSVTIEGVTAVVDSGLARIATHSAWTGISRLQVARISRASAIQRAGRAGRTAPGLAVRLFTQEDFVRRPDATPPEVVRADWAEPLLRLIAAGYKTSELRWLDEPPLASVEAAAELLTRFHAIDSAQQITDFGRRLARLPVHPRIGCLALKGAEFGAARESAHVAGWLSDESARIDRRNPSHLSSDLEAILSADLSYGARRVQSLLGNATRSGPVGAHPYALEQAVLAAYPDRVASRRGETLLLSNGTSAKLDSASLAAHASFLVALDVDDRSDLGLPRVRLASSVQPDWLLDLFPERIEASDELRWNRAAERIEQVSLLRYDRLIIDETVHPPTDLEAATKLLISRALELDITHFTDVEPVNRLFARLRFAALHGANLSSEEQLLLHAFHQIGKGLVSFADLRQSASAGLLDALESQLDRRLLDEIAPTHVRLPSGRRAPIEYIDGQPPAASSRLQDFFGMLQTPAVARGAVPLTVKLLAPNGRPVQITTDLVSFWKDLYPQVRRELSRRYPRHSWPETPA